MKTIIKFPKTAFVAVTMALGTTFGYAQTDDTPPAKESKLGIRVGIAADALSPVGKISKNYDGGYGVSVQGEMPFMRTMFRDNLYLTLNTGFTRIYAKEDTEGNPQMPDITLIPGVVGFKSYLWRNLYFQGNSGVSFLTNKSDFVGGKTFALTFGQQVGYTFPVGKRSNLDASARFESNTMLYTGANASNYFGFRLAYTFNL